eukprot:scaffold15689_cov135-Isochrysis_galbana.AAC.2
MADEVLWHITRCVRQARSKLRCSASAKQVMMRSVCLTLGVRFWPGWDEIYVHVIEIVVAGHVDHDGRLETTVKPEEPDTATAVPEGPGANGVCSGRLRRRGWGNKAGI